MSDEQLQVPAEVKKSRRRTAFYPTPPNTTNTKPFSKSAARRESVLALGSIEHLQHYFTKTGLTAKQKPDLKGKGLVPAIGGGHLRTPSVLNGIPQLKFDLPDTPFVPAPPSQPVQPIFAAKDYQVDPEELLPGLVNDLERVSQLWGLGTSDPRMFASPSLSTLSVSPNLSPVALKPSLIPAIGVTGDFDVLAVLQATTQAIRSVRNYLLALPSDDPAHASLHPSHQEFRPHTISRRPQPLSKQSSSGNLRAKGAMKEKDQPLILIRQSALKVLEVLRTIEEKYRLPMTDESFEILSDLGSGSGPSNPSRSRAQSPHSPHSQEHTSDDTESSASFNFSVVTMPGRSRPVPVWEDEEDDIAQLEEQEKRERWDEKLILGGGWLYRNDVSFSEVETEREIIAGYLDTVDTVLFRADVSGGIRGWAKHLQRKQRRSSTRGRSPSPEPSAPPSRRESTSAAQRTGLLLETMQNLNLTDVVVEEPDEIDEDYLPNWARRTEFTDDPLARAYALLVALLPAELLHILPSPAEPLTATNLMESLSSGQLLCVAYNAGVRKSKKPWGYIDAKAIWDIAALEAEGGEDAKKWTFRRTENLKLWAAALKLRYMIPLVSIAQLSGATQSTNPSRVGTPLSSPGAATVAFRDGLVPNLFDATTVAKKGDYWEEMLHDAVLLWMEKLIEEKRNE